MTLRAPRPEKIAVVDEVQARLEASSGALLTEYRGLAVKDVETLRKALRTAGGEYKIYKNTLVRRAVAASGHESLEPLLTGPTGIAFVDGDVAAVAKVLRDFARTNPNLVVKGGVVGRDVLDAKQASALAELPSREVLLAQIAGLLAAPMQRFAGLLQAVPLKFAYALKALIEEQGGAPEESVATDVAPAASDGTAEGSVEDDAAVAEASATAEAPAEEISAPNDSAPKDSAPEETPAEEGAANEPAAVAPEAVADETPTGESVAEAPAPSATADGDD
ncbi:MAG TPA: 50S ribosomal protein L10 [Acidimicrobiales bacterium]|nr:50S ribosomal protein L10 [Acidimicrobiales bacterium]